MPAKPLPRETKRQRISGPDSIADASAPREILMVEDSATDAELAMRALARAKIANPLKVIDSGEEALDYLLGRGRYAKAGAGQPLLILLDLNLPGMSGIDFLRQLKLDDRTRDFPVATLSLTKSAPAIMACLRLGADDHLIKPVRFDALAGLAKKLRLRLTRLTEVPVASGLGVSARKAP